MAPHATCRTSHATSHVRGPLRRTARDRWPGLECLLFLLLWAATEAGRRLWAELKRRADAGQSLGAALHQALLK